MSLLAKLTPTNLASEKAKFSSDYNYNPQFIYAEPILPAKLQKYGQTKPAMVQLAQAYLAAHPLPTASSPEDTTPITANQVQQEVLALCQRLRIKPPQIIFSNQLITRFVVLQDKLIINNSPLSKFSQETLPALLAHELQTHYLRFYNQQQQSFASQKRIDYLRTEEGLAILVGSFYKPQLNFSAICALYIGVDLAQKASFSQVFAYFSQNGLGFNQAWAKTMRVKRGLEDTSQPGGLTKDLVYLEGVWEVCDYLLYPNSSLLIYIWAKFLGSKLPFIINKPILRQCAIRSLCRIVFRIFCRTCALANLSWHRPHLKKFFLTTIGHFH